MLCLCIGGVLARELGGKIQKLCDFRCNNDKYFLVSYTLLSLQAKIEN
jgi:hypothetical protein